MMSPVTGSIQPPRVTFPGVDTCPKKTISDAPSIMGVADPGGSQGLLASLEPVGYPRDRVGTVPCDGWGHVCPERPTATIQAWVGSGMSLKSEGPNNRSIPERVKASSQSRAQFGSGVASRRVSAPRGHAGSPMLRIRASVVPATAELRAVATDRDVFNAKDGSRRSEEHSRGKRLVAVVVAEC